LLFRDKKTKKGSEKMKSREGTLLRIEARTLVVKGDYLDLLVLQGEDHRLIFYFEKIGLEARCESKSKNFSRYVAYERGDNTFSFNGKPFDVIGYESLGNNSLVLKTRLLNYKFAFRIDTKNKRLLSVDILIN